MIIARTIRECREHRRSLARLALVPTMGALHAGHLSLVERAREYAAHVAVTIFVNPTQFGPHEDFHRYPRPLEHDLDLCRKAGIDLVFAPGVEEIYPPDRPRTVVDVPALTGTLEGKHRPGHFAGVCQVVAKLFHITTPEVACFGEKDFQQLAVLRAMSAGLDLDIKIVGCPTLRDPDGLAMSSRNRYLSADERKRALAISRSLFEIAQRAAAGEKSAEILRRTLADGLATDGDLPKVPVSVDYATIVDAQTLEEIATLDRPARAVVAMRVGSTRLIDNVPL